MVICSGIKTILEILLNPRPILKYLVTKVILMAKDYRFDLHIHTIYSDGMIKPADVIKYAKVMGMDGVAITDHDTFDGSKKAAKAAKKEGVILVPGVEITTRFGDILALGIKEAIYGLDADLSGIKKIIHKIHEKGGAAIIAHPFVGSWPNGSLADHIKKLDFDAIEIFNSMTSDIFGIETNVKAMELAKKMKMPGTGGSDAHSLEMIGTAFTISKTKDIVSAIKKGNIKAGWV